ncbi:hypothetical protein AYI69_g7921 [Smittium culicis]|uniref:Integrase catalytic domain-containing protein n=1 Tax=Smittium culicis TaxID=133412 RepID=A0A1R1XNH8_9FUNG|nr:hypothetical protein AYI69_g7921 [Smittium culicis]
MTSYFCKFIKNLSGIAKPHKSLLKKETQFVWGESQQKAFETLKYFLSAIPVLVYPDWSIEFFITADAPYSGLGTILSQQFPEGEKSIAYASRTLLKPEKKLLHHSPDALGRSTSGTLRRGSVAYRKTVHEEGRAGFEITRRKLKDSYFIPGAKKNIKRVIENCEICQRNQRILRTEELHPIVVTEPMKVWGIDIPGPINPKILSARADKRVTSGEIIMFIPEEIVSNFGLPKQMISEQGLNLISNTVKNFYQYSSITSTPVTVYRPQANVQVERIIQTLKGTIRKLVKADFQNWDGYLWKALMNIRKNYHRTIGRTTAELFYGKQIMTPAVWD